MGLEIFCLEKTKGVEISIEAIQTSLPHYKSIKSLRKSVPYIFELIGFGLKLLLEESFRTFKIYQNTTHQVKY